MCNAKALQCSFVAHLLFFPLHNLNAQPSVELHQAFLDLSQDGVVMNVSAHPDDEDGATLAYYRMKFGAKTYSVFFTRGEGGQNEIGPELYEELGAIRTQETEAAARIQVTEAHFLNLLDFGYSKTATEAFQKWGGKREVLRRLVEVIRRLKPDIIFSNHNTIDGHGHHQAAAVTAIEAFDAAGDSTYFPEQLREPGLTLWQPRKLFFRNFGRSDQKADVINSIGDTNGMRGMSYLDIAALALKQHRSQGMDKADLRRFTRGQSLYKLMRANSLYEQDSTTFFGGMDYWRDHSLIPLSGIRALITPLHAGMSRDSALGAASTLLTGIHRLEPLTLSPMGKRLLAHWELEVEELVRVLCGISLSFKFGDSVVVAKQRVECTLAVSTGECPISGVKHVFDSPQGWAVTGREGRAAEMRLTSYSRDFTLHVGETSMFTVPKTRMQYYSLGRRDEVVARIRFSAGGHPLSVSTSARFDVAPPQVLSVSPIVARLSQARLSEGKKFEVTIKSFLPHEVAGKVDVEGPNGWRAGAATFAIAHEDSVARVSIVARPPKDLKPGEYKFRFKSDYGVDSATIKVFGVEVAKGVRVGIVKSYDNTLEEALGELGVQFQLLEEKDLRERTLSQYTTILVDIRGYAMRDDLRKYNQSLLDYARGGGHLVVFYQKDQDWKSEYAPYPMQLTRKRICTEEAPMEILQSRHPLLNSPNKIVDADWEGWVQERGVYFPASLAPEYVQLLTSHDPDEPELKTGYLLANVGKGSYIYTSYVWYRQLKEYNPGVYRCFANMISYPLVVR